MILTFHVPPLASGEGLCDIDRSNSEKFQKMESPGTVELDRFLVKLENSNYRSNVAVSGLSIFWIFSELLLTIPIPVLYRYHIVPAENEYVLFWDISKTNAYAITCKIYPPHTFWGISRYPPYQYQFRWIDGN